MFKIDHGRWYRHAWLTVLLCIMPLTGCSDEDPTDRVLMTPEEVQAFKFRSTVEGIDFDVPVNYHYEQYAMFHVWPRPPRVQLDGRERRKADTISITALLPDMMPYTESNAAEFEQPGFGKRVRATLFKRRSGITNWQYYFDNAGKRLERLSESPDVPGMVHYSDPLARQDVYLSHDHPEKDLIRIICIGDTKAGEFPYCKLESLYSDRFNLDITFGQPYLGQWRDIEKKVRQVFDNFRASAQQQSKSK